MTDDLRPLLDTVPVAMVIVGPDGVVRAGNTASASLCGGDPTGRPVAELAQPRLLVLAEPQISLVAAGLAHELNNPLAALLLNLDLAVRQLSALPGSPEVDRARDDLRDAVASGERLRAAVRELTRVGSSLGTVPAPPAPAPARRARVLVVDDEPLITRAVRRILGNRHDVSTVDNATSALEVILGSDRPFDVILCDLMMPEMSGMDLFEELDRIAHPQARRVVFMTGGAYTPRARDFLAAIGNRRVDKPFEAAALRALIDGLVA